MLKHKNYLIGFICLWLAAFFSLAQASGINDTGINTCSNGTQNGLFCPINEFPGQDAEYGTNSFNFTKLDASGVPLPNNATDYNCVRDNITGLVWEIKSSDGSWRDKSWTYTWYNSNAPNGSPGTPSGGNCKYSGRCDTEKYVADVNNDELCGFNDWRLPDIKELTGIVNYSKASPGPTINTNYFPDTLSTYFWSSTPYIRNSTDMWVVGFDNGYTSTRGDRDAIRLVRGTPIATQLLDNSDGTVTDNATGLMWEKCSEGQTLSGSSCSGIFANLTWNAALIAARNSRLGGYSDWRLPNAKELQSLVDYTRYGPSINRTMFPNTTTALFWTSSPDASASNLSLVTEFNYGYLNTSSIANRTYGNAVRLVRAGNQSSTYALGVGKNGVGSGTVVSSPAGINCGTDCNEAYTPNTTVTLTATPTATSTFSGWSGDCSGSATTCTVNVTAAKGVFATFNAAPNTYVLNITKTGNGSGSIISNPAGIKCGLDCNEPYFSGTIALTAIEARGSGFVGWGGACTGTGVCTVNMNQNRSVTAEFGILGSLNVLINRVTSSCGTISTSVSVLDGQGNPVTGLNASSFSILEDTAVANNCTISVATAPIRTIMVLDRSGSMGGTPIASLKTAAKAFIDSLGANDQVAIYSFSDDISFDQPLTSNKTLLNSKIDAIVAGGSTNLYGAVETATQYAATVPGRVSVVVMTDGEDNWAAIGLDQLQINLEARGVPVFTIGLVGDGGVNQDVLQNMATWTNGVYYSAPTAADLVTMYQHVSNILNNQYQLTCGDLNNDSQPHQLSVTVRQPSPLAEGTDMHLYTRSSCTSAMVTPNVDRGVSVNPSIPQTVGIGSTQSFNVTFKAGYIKSPKGVSGTCPSGSWSGNTWTTGVITADCLVKFNSFCLLCLPDRSGWRSAQH